MTGRAFRIELERMAENLDPVAARDLRLFAEACERQGIETMADAVLFAVGMIAALKARANPTP